MMNKMLGVFFLLSCVLCVSAGENYRMKVACTTARDELLASMPHLKLCLYPDQCLHEHNDLIADDTERNQLREYAQQGLRFNCAYLKFLSRALTYIKVYRPSLEEFSKAIDRYRAIDADGINLTCYFALRYLRSGTMDDAIRELKIERLRRYLKEIEMSDHCLMERIKKQIADLENALPKKDCYADEVRILWRVLAGKRYFHACSPINGSEYAHFA